jgi:hypothetical protein
MSRIGGKLTVRKRKLRNMQYCFSQPLGILARILLRNNTTLLEATMTNIEMDHTVMGKGQQNTIVQKYLPYLAHQVGYKRI